MLTPPKRAYTPHKTHTSEIRRRRTASRVFELQFALTPRLFAALRRSFRAAPRRSVPGEASQAPTQRGVGRRPPRENRRARRRRRGTAKRTANCTSPPRPREQRGASSTRLARQSNLPSRPLNPNLIIIHWLVQSGHQDPDACPADADLHSRPPRPLTWLSRAPLAG